MKDIIRSTQKQFFFYKENVLATAPFPWIYDPNRSWK